MDTGADMKAVGGTEPEVPVVIEVVEGVVDQVVKVEWAADRAEAEETQDAGAEGTKDVVTQDEELLDVSEKKSPVWIYFAYKKGPNGKAENPERVTCKMCRKQYWAKGGNTSNLFKHLSATHPEEFVRVKAVARNKAVVPKPVAPSKQTTLPFIDQAEVEETQGRGAGRTKDVVSQDEELLDASEKKSAVWMYFAYKKGPNGKPENTERVTCKKCRKQYWAKGGNTSNLFKHLNATHPDEFVRVKAVARKKAVLRKKAVTCKKAVAYKKVVAWKKGSVPKPVTHSKQTTLPSDQAEVEETQGAGASAGGTKDFISEDEELLDVSEKKSAIWIFFAYKKGHNGKPENTERVTCKMCRKQYWARGGNTSNLFKHLNGAHPEEFVRVKAVARNKAVVPKPVAPSKQTTLFQSFNLYSREDEEWKALTDKVTYCLAKDILPIYSVEKGGFKELLKAFDSRYELPSRKYFSRTAIPKLFNATSTAVREKLSIGMTYYSATGDLWSSRTMETYLSFSVHYIDHEWNQQTHCIETIFLPQDHTAMNIEGALKSIMDDWNLPVSNLVAMTTDNDDNMKKAVNALGVQHVPCFGHNLNLAVTKSWKDDRRVSQAVAACKTIVGHFSHSQKRRNDLAEWQEELKVMPQSLISENASRWGSRQAMIRRFLEQGQPLQKVLANDAASTHLLPTDQDMDMLKSMDQALTPLSQFTDLISGHDHVTSSFVLPTLELFESDIMAAKEGDGDLTKDMKATMLKEFKDRYDHVPSTLALLEKACFLDPRYKTDYMDDIKVEAVKTAICEDGAKLIEEKVTNPYQASLPPTGADSTVVGYQHQKRKFGDMLSKVKKRGRVAMPVVAECTPTNLQVLKKEVDAYIAGDTIPWESNPLQWWKEQALNFPWLALLACKYLCVCGSSSTLERLFSAAGDIVSPTRSRLKPDKVRMLTFLAKNLD